MFSHRAIFSAQITYIYTSEKDCTNLTINVWTLWNCQLTLFVVNYILFEDQLDFVVSNEICRS